MDVSPFLIRLSGGLGEVEHRVSRKSNETAVALRRVADTAGASQNYPRSRLRGFRIARRSYGLQIAYTFFICRISSLEPGRDLHDFDIFADCALASVF
jgi:hypothetical protein